MKSALGMLLIFFVISLMQIGVGILFGFLLHRTFPGIDFGSGTLVGVIVTVSSIYFITRAIMMIEPITVQDDQDEEEEEAPETLPRPTWHAPNPFASDRKRRRKRR
jgi:hypothetical protein